MSIRSRKLYLAKNALSRDRFNLTDFSLIERAGTSRSTPSPEHETWSSTSGRAQVDVHAQLRDQPC